MQQQRFVGLLLYGSVPMVGRGGARYSSKQGRQDPALTELSSWWERQAVTAPFNKHMSQF